MIIVKQETFDSFAQSLFEKTGEDNFSKDVAEVMEAENPVLCRAAEIFINHALHCADEGDIDGTISNMFTAHCVIYKLLRSQAEADKMNADYL